MTLRRIGGTHKASRIARRVAAFIPRSLTDRLLHREQLEPGQGRQVEAAALFCDISGFSTMTNELAADGPRGAEELNRLLLMTLTAMINAIHNAGGYVSHFHGDGLMVCFLNDDHQAANRALACAQFMQSLMSGAYSRVAAQRPNNTTTYFDLTMKVGVGYGRCLEIVVGDPHTTLEYVLAGQAIDDAVVAESLATAGQVIASAETLKKAGLHSSQPFEPFTDIFPVPFTQNTIHWDAYNSDQLWEMATIASRFIPRPLWERIIDDSTAFIAEHRPIVSMFVNFAGIDYGADDAAQKLQEYYLWASRVVTRHGSGNCHINRVLTGDKGSVLHIIFGAPVAPDAPEQALLCALELQQHRPSFVTNQQIGVAAGQAFACAVGSQNRREYTVVGDVVNLSARLMARCENLQILTDEHTIQRVQDTIRYDRLPPVPFKGFSIPVPLYEIRGSRSSTGSLATQIRQASEAIVGRRQEEHLLLQRLTQAREGLGGALLIDGSTGRERMRLVAAGIAQWHKAHGQSYIGLGARALRDVPYGIWQNMWRDLFQLDESEDLENQAHHIEDLLQKASPQHVRDIPLLEPILGIPLPFTRKSMIGLGLAEQQTRLFEMLRHILSYHAEQQPLMLILENVQWADTAGLSLLHHLIAQAADLSLFILITAGDQPDFAATALPQMTHIHLADISIREGRRLVQKMLNDHTIPTGLYEHLGLDNEQESVNPAVLEEKIKRLIQTETLQHKDSDGRLALNREELSNLPASHDMSSLLLAKLDRLSPQGRHLLQAAAVIGREFTLETLDATILSLDSINIDVVLPELIQAEMLYRLPTDNKLLFVDEMIRKVAYESVPYGRRQRWHAEIAEWLTQRVSTQPMLYPLIAYHYSQTDFHERAIYYSLLAGDGARQTTPGTALQLYSLSEPHLEALGVETRWQEALTLYLARAELAWILERYEEAGRNAENALSLAHRFQDGETLAKIYNLLGRIAHRQADFDRTLSYGRKVTHEMGETVSIQQLAHAELNIAAGYLRQGEFETARNQLESLDKAFSQMEDPVGRVRVLLLLGSEYFSQSGQWEKARAKYRQAQKLVSLTGEYSIENLIRLMIGFAEVDLVAGNLERALSYINHAQEIAVENNLRWWQSTTHYFLARVQIELGRLSRANTLLERGVRAVKAGGNPDYLPLIYLELAKLMPNPMVQRELVRSCEQALAARCRPLDQQRIKAALAELGAPV